MKKLFAVSLGVVLFLFGTGCDNGSKLQRPDGTILITVEREVSTDFNPVLMLAAKEARLDYGNRLLKASGLAMVGGQKTRGGLFFTQSWPVSEITIIYSGEVVVKIPPDAVYLVKIGDQEHILTAVKQKK